MSNIPCAAAYELHILRLEPSFQPDTMYVSTTFVAFPVEVRSTHASVSDQVQHPLYDRSRPRRMPSGTWMHVVAVVLF